MPSPLADWQNYYVIAGSSAGALTGLQFVVITLVAQTNRVRGMREIRAFATPTVIHFCTALLISALMAVPWRELSNLGICLAIAGAAGIAYATQTFWHARKSAYAPDVEDWLWYTVFPFIGHLAVLAAGVLTFWNPALAVSIAAADTLLFLLLGIHNAWDTVTYVAIEHGRNRDSPETPESLSEGD